MRPEGKKTIDDFGDKQAWEVYKLPFVFIYDMLSIRDSGWKLTF